MRLLALTGHALSVLREATPAGELVVRPLLPRLAAPVLLDERRLLLRRALAAPGRQAEDRLQVLRLLAARGYAAHPEDWSPSLSELGQIDLYAPWANWREGLSERRSDDYPTVETWSDWGWSQGHAALARLRKIEPGAARELVAAILPGEHAEKRIRLVALLGQNLATADKAFLEVLATDRSDRVKSEARRLLARLGGFSAPGEAEAELKDFFEIKRAGLLRRRTAVAAHPFKTPAQQNRAVELLSHTNLATLANAMAISDEELVRGWELSNTVLDTVFVRCIAETGSEAAQEVFAARCEAALEFAPMALADFAHASAGALRRRLAKAVAAQTATFGPALAVAGPDIGWAPASTIAAGEAWRNLQNTTPPVEDNAARERLLSQELWALGLLCDSVAAQMVLKTLSEFGGSTSDPACDLLRFNAALTETSTP